jgi:serine protease
MKRVLVGSTILLAWTLVASGVNASPWQEGVLYVRYVDSVDVPLLTDAMTAPHAVFAEGLLSGAIWNQRAASVDAETWQVMLDKTRERFGSQVPDARQSVMLKLAEGVDEDTAVEAVSRLPFVADARRVPMIFRPSSLTPPDYQSDQDYLEIGGVWAQVVWSIHDTAGQGVTICDIEGSFNQSHCDLPDIQIVGPDPDQFGDDPNHGTAVLGEALSIDNGFGTTGIAHGAAGAFATYFNFSGWDLGTAIINATNALPQGSIQILEIHIPGPNYQNDGSQYGLVPAEWYEPWYVDIQTAVANGMIVVEAGGNGSQDLDDPVYQTDNGGHYPFVPGNDSGAIIVGAGGAYQSCYGNVWRSRLSFSNYGSRVDVQGWGECVVTTGYGGLWNDPDCDYTNTFGGTSSASPIVAGAAALMQSWMQIQYGVSAGSVMMREWLKETGSEQTNGQYPASQNIGPLPNAYSAIETFDIEDYTALVPEDYATIQEAIDSSDGLLRIVVGPGVYEGVLDLHGRSINIISAEGAEQTIIDGQQAGVVLRMLEGENAIIEGFTITGGYSSLGSACRSNGSAQIIDCIVRDNESTSNYVIYSVSDLLVSGTTICSNSHNTIGGTWNDGGGNEFLEDCETPDCPGDATGDGQIDVNDVLYVISNWDTADPNADFDGDGLVDADDVLILLSHFGEDCP